MLAVHLENLLFLLLLVVAGLFQLLGRAARKGSTDEQTKPTPKPRPIAPRPIPRAPVESDQERIRKFLEALGQPPASPPPSPITPRPTYRKPLVLPRIPPIASPLPPLVTRPPDLPREFEVHREAAPTLAQQQQPQPSRTLPEPTFQVHQTVVSPELVPVVVTTVPEAKRQQQIGASPSVIDVITLLRSATRLRDAIILREILGPPRGLREPELL